jgi:hypothetical protein
MNRLVKYLLGELRLTGDSPLDLGNLDHRLASWAELDVAEGEAIHPLCQ